MSPLTPPLQERKARFKYRVASLTIHEKFIIFMPIGQYFVERTVVSNHFSTSYFDSFNFTNSRTPQENTNSLSANCESGSSGLTFCPYTSSILKDISSKAKRLSKNMLQSPTHTHTHTHTHTDTHTHTVLGYSHPRFSPTSGVSTASIRDIFFSGLLTLIVTGTKCKVDYYLFTFRDIISHTHDL